jgi:hypothetical protein
VSGVVTPSIPVTTIDAAGVSIPTYEAIFSALVASAQAIFGSGINVDADSPDGQLIGVYAQATFDACNAAGAAYNNFSPATAQGAGLSSVIKINGLHRMIGEVDAPLRQRQSISTGNPAQTIQAGLVGAIASIDGVTRYNVVVNSTNATVGGVPAFNTAVVVENGAASDVVAAIALRKTLGTPTFGSSSGVYTDPTGVTTTINYTRPTDKPIAFAVTIKALAGYSTTVGSAMEAALAAYAEANQIGAVLRWVGAITTAQSAAGSPAVFSVESLTMGDLGGTLTATDYTPTYYGATTGSATNVTLTVT